MTDSESTPLNRTGFRHWIVSSVVVLAASAAGIWSYMDQHDEPTQVASVSQLKPARLQFALDDESIERRLRESTEYLASDELQGRGVRTKGIDLAADFIAKRFVECGLKTKHFQSPKDIMNLLFYIFIFCKYLFLHYLRISTLSIL